MEGGQKLEISLESGLDVKSSDQLVPAARPLFQHNRQRFQGSTLPTSLRYEHNGWACGWDVYEFEVDVTAVETEPAGYTVIRTKLNDNPTYIFQVRSWTTTYVQIWYNAADTDLTGGLDIEHATPSTVTVKGENNGSAFTITIDMLSGDISVDDEEHWYIAEASYADATASSGTTMLNMTDLTSWVMFNAAIVEAEDVEYNGESVAEYYSCADGNHVWKDIAGGAWTVEYEIGSDTASVNGDDADAKNDNGQLAISYATKYEDSISLSFSTSQSYLQVYGLGVKQSYDTVTSSSSGHEVENWSVSSSGDTYLFPVDTSANAMYLTGNIPYWIGFSMSMTSTSESGYVDYSNVDIEEDVGLSGISVNGYYLSNSYLKLYDVAATSGVNFKFWVGATECSSEHVDIDEGSFSVFDNIYGKAVFNLCVLNTISTNDGTDEDAEEGYPFTAGDRVEGENYFVTERAPWFDGGSLMNMAGDMSDFEAGFYAPVEQEMDETGTVGTGMWRVVASDLEDSSFPYIYTSEQVVGDEESDFYGYARLDSPLAFYGIEATLSSWDGSKYTSSYYSEDAAELIGAASVDFLCQVLYRSGTDSIGNMYTWGYVGYVKPYFDSREMLDVVSTESASSSGTSYTATFTSGPLVGMSVGITSSTATISYISKNSAKSITSNLSTSQKTTISSNICYSTTLYGMSNKWEFCWYVPTVGGSIADAEGFLVFSEQGGNGNTYYWKTLDEWKSFFDYGGEGNGSRSRATVLSSFDKLGSALKGLYENTYPSDEYSYTIYLYAYCRSVNGDRHKQRTMRFFKYAVDIAYPKYKFSVTHSGSVSNIFSVENATSAVVTSKCQYFDIAPRYAAAIAEGLSASDYAGTASASLMMSFCYDGKFQSTVKLNDTDNHVFTSSNISECFSCEASSNLELVDKTGFYIDRETSDSYSFFGVNEFQVVANMLSLNSSSFSAYLYGCPAMSSNGNYCSIYVFTASSDESDTILIPGNVYYGSASNITKGYNLTAQSMPVSYSASSIVMNLSGTAIAFYFATGASFSWIADAGTHMFYSDVLPQAVALMSSSGIVSDNPSNSSNGNASLVQWCSLDFNGLSLVFTISHLLKGGSMTTSVTLSDSVSTEYMGYTFTFSMSSYSWSSLSCIVELLVSVPLHYDFTTGLPYQYNYTSLSHEDSKYYVDGNEEGMDALPVGTYAVSYDNTKQVYTFMTDSGYSYTYNVSTKELTYGTESYDTEKVGDARTAEIEALEALELSFILQGAYKISKGEIVSFGESSIAFKYNGVEYAFDFSNLMADTAVNRLAFMYTDTTDDSAVPQSVTFAVQDTTSEYQFLRQAWNTLVEVENYWWIDDSTILELNKTSLTVKRKLSSLDSYNSETDVDVDDWGGDAWVDAYSFDRGDYIDNTVARYGVTCAYGGEAPRLWTVKVASTLSVQITFYELECKSDYSYSLDGTSVTVPVNVVSIGSELNASEGSLNTYSQLSAETIIYEAKYTGTVVDGHILFGVHLDNNFNQWALDIYGGSVNLVVQGYGYVGLNGCLTGGEIPSEFFNAAKGFDGTVMPIDTLEQEDTEYVDSMSDFLALDADGTVVGDESQQWYISKSLSGIVSHLIWDNGSWSVVSLPITNTYSSCYGSPSYGKRVISDYSFWAQNLSSLINDDGFTDAVDTLTNLLTTKVFGFSPKVTTAMYLQQTMGQYAYVHYNSVSPGKQKDVTREDDSENIFGDYGVNGTSYTAIGSARRKKEEPIEAVSPENSDDFSFNMKGVRQSIAVTKPWSGSYGIMVVIMNSLSSLTSTLSNVLDTVKVNASEGKVSVGMKGRDMSQIFLQNMADLAITDISVVGVLPELQSAVGSACTLDMFYSTSEGQKVEAGPGWVQHNMVAQCVAQSVTSCQWEMQQIGMLWILDGISSISARVAYEAARIAWEIACEESSATKEGSTMSTNYGWIAAVVIIGLAGIAYALCATYKVCAEITDELVRSICGGGAKVEVQNASSKHTYDVEGKHKYGTKSEVFMWPCFDVNSANTYTDEKVESVLSEHNWGLHVPLFSGQAFMGGLSDTLGSISLEGALGSDRQDDNVTSSFDGDILYQIANCRGTRTSRTLPSNMAVVTGSDSFLPPVPFRNGNIGVSEPVFPTPCFQDYIIDKDWELSRTASVSMTQWISCKDTKLIDGEASNIVVSDDFCGVAAPYVAIEVKRGCEQKYIRPWAITPNALALNQTGYNCCYDRKAYHAFDGYGYRIVKWCGAPGMNKEGRVFQYSFIVNDRFKRSNRMPLNEFIGNFRGDPTIALKTTGDDWVYNQVTFPSRGEGLSAGTVGEDKDVRRYALPVFSELVSTLPAVVKTISSSNLSVIDGITSLTTDVRDAQSAYKAPISVDFAIGRDKYRFTEEYICHLNVDPASGVTTVEETVPTLGLTFLGATPYEAYLYSQATRQYYSYSGGPRLDAVDTLERFRDVLFGRYDFVNQEVAVPCVATFDRLDKHVHDDDDERDNVIVPRLKDGKFMGEVSPPIETIYNMRSGFRTVSLPSGLCYQGPNRCIINRFVYSDYMKEQIKENYGKWKRVPRERYHPFRIYGSEYERVDENIESDLVGWTHNQFLLVTSPLGTNSETDCLFEWEITFAWPVEMDELYGCGQYATVNVLGECFTPGGKVVPDRPAHVFLWKDLFTRTGNYGYYSFRYQSRCGAGNRERLHIWSDQYIAISGLRVDVKPVTEKRTEVLTQQADVMRMEEI